MNPQRANVVLGIALIVLMFTLGVAFIQKGRAAAAHEETMNRFKQTALSLQACNDTHRRLPPAFDRFAAIPYPAAVHVHFLPFVEQGPLYQTFLEEGKGRETAYVPAFHAPSDGSLGDPAGSQNFAANLRVFARKGLKAQWDKDLPPLAAVEPGESRIPATFIRGTSNTIVFATKFGLCGFGGSRYAAAATSPFAAFFGHNVAQGPAHPTETRAVFQLAPTQSECLTTPLMAQSFQDGGLLVGLGDGSVRSLTTTFDPVLWNGALQPNDSHFFEE